MHARKSSQASALGTVQDVRDSHVRLSFQHRLHPEGVATNANLRIQEDAGPRVEAVLDQLHGRHLDPVEAEPDLVRLVEGDATDEILRQRRDG